MRRVLNRRALLREIGLASMGVAGTALMGACAPKAAPTPTAAPQAQPASVPKPAATSAPASKEAVTITLGFEAGSEISEPAIYVERPTDFMKENSSIKVELAPIPANEYEVKVQTMAAAGSIPDVVCAVCYLAFQLRLIRQGVLAASDPYLDAYGISKDEWLPAAVESISLDGKMYGFPKCAHPGEVYLFLNEDQFQEAGLPIPEAYGNKPEQLAEWAAKLVKGPEKDRERYGYYFGVSGFHHFSTPVRSFGGDMLNEEGTKSLTDSPEWYEWAQYTNAFYRKALTPHEGGLPSGGANALFVGGKIPIYRSARSNWIRVVTGLKEAGNPFKMRLIQLPRTEKARGWPANPDVHAATTNSKHPEEAFLLAWALADKRFAELVIGGIGYLTARVDDADTLQKAAVGAEQREFLDMQYKSQSQTEALNLPANTRGSEVAKAYANEFQPVWLGERELTPDVMKEITGKIDEILAKPM